MTLDAATTKSSELPRLREKLDGRQLPSMRIPQARGDPCRVPISLLLVCPKFSLWRVAADVQVAPGPRRCLSNQPTWHTSGTLTTVFRFTTKEFFLRGFDRERLQSQNVSSQIGTWFDIFCEW